MLTIYAVWLSTRISGVPALSYLSALVVLSAVSGIGFAELLRGFTATISSFKSWKMKRASVSESTIEQLAKATKGIL